MRSTKTAVILFMFFVPLLWPALGSAQVAPPVGRGLELGAFVGESYGLDKFRPMFGGNVAYGVTRALFPFFEASYLPGLERSFDSGNGATTRYKIDMTDVHGGVHLRLPIGGSRIVPYGVFGLGLVHSSSTTTQLYSVTQMGTSIYLGSEPIPANTSFAVNLGGGLRFFLTERFGLRLEFKAFVPTSSPTGVSNDIFYRFAIGPVFQVK